MNTHVAKLTLITTLMVGIVPIALAEPVKFEALVARKEAMQLNFTDQSKRYLLLVRQEGKSEGQGPLAGATVQDYSAHDIVPGVGGEAVGYLEFTTADGSKAYIKTVLQAVFVPGPEGKPKPLPDGVWKVVGATGKLEKLKGAGTFRLGFPSPTERRFVMEGELVQ